MLFWGIKKETAQIDFHLLVSALRATPTASLAAALAATALSYLALVGYDVSGLRYARAHAPLKTILLASFCGFAIGNSVGLGAFSGGAVRYRLYTAAGLSPGQIARVILFISIAFGVGLGAIAALGLILHAREVSGLLGASPEPLRAGAATVLALAIGFMIFCALRRTPWRRGPIEIDAPDTTLVLIQFLLTAVDVLAAAATLWVLLPSVGISFFSFAAIYAAALGAGRAEPYSRRAWCLRSRNSLRRRSQRASERCSRRLGDLPRPSTFYSPCCSRPSSWPTSNCSARSTRQWVDGSVVRQAGLHPTFLPQPLLPSARFLSCRVPCRPSSIGCKSCRSLFRSGRSRSLISSPASPVSSCYLPRTACTSGSTALGGSLCA